MEDTALKHKRTLLQHIPLIKIIYLAKIAAVQETQISNGFSTSTKMKLLDIILLQSTSNPVSNKGIKDTQCNRLLDIFAQRTWN
jgi:hypothetical protein